jgi:hypothetical protein
MAGSSTMDLPHACGIANKKIQIFVKTVRKIISRIKLSQHFYPSAGIAEEQKLIYKRLCHVC